MVGKWHLKSDPTGFDFWQVLQGQGPYYNPPMNTPDGVKKITGYTTDVITDVSLDWLKNKRSQQTFHSHEPAQSTSPQLATGPQISDQI